MVATVSIKLQSLEISDVGDVIVTDTVQSDEGDYVRDIRVYDRAVDVDPDTGQLKAGQLVVHLRIRSITRVALELTAPPQQF